MRRANAAGLLSLFKLSKFLFPAVNRPRPDQQNSREVLSSLASLAQTLDGKLLVGFDTEREQELILMIGAMGLESFARAAGEIPAGKIAASSWATAGTSKTWPFAKACAWSSSPAASRWSPKPWRPRSKQNVTVITSPHDTATTASLCRAAVAVQPRAERGIPLLSRKRPAGGGARGSHVLRLPGLSRAGQRRRNRGHPFQDGFSENGHAQADSGGSQRTVPGRAGRRRGGNHRDH